MHDRATISNLKIRICNAPEINEIGDLNGHDHLFNCHGWNLHSISAREVIVKEAVSGVVLAESGPKSDLRNSEIGQKLSKNGSNRHDEEVWDGPEERQMPVLSSDCTFNIVSHPPGTRLNS